MSITEKIDISVDKKQTIHFRVARAMVICAVLIISLLVLVAVTALGTTSSYLTKDIAQSYIAHVGPNIRQVLKRNGSSKELSQKMAAFEHLNLISYAVLLDEHNNTLTEWQSAGIKGAFNAKMAKKATIGELTNS